MTNFSPPELGQAVPIGAAVTAGPASLRLTLTDRSGNAKTIRRRVSVPAA